MNLLECLLTNNPCYKSRQLIVPKGVMVHSTGANNPTLKRYVQPMADNPNHSELLRLLGTNIYNNDWNHVSENACVHAFIGKLADGTVATVQTLPWNLRGWHAGTGTKGSSYSANNTHISFEICEDALTDKLYFEQSKKEAVELTAMLCTLYDLDPMEPGVVICHADGWKLGIASNHGDVYNWWNKYKYTMDDLRAEVVEAMKQPDTTEEDNITYYETFASVPSDYRPTIQKLIDAEVLLGTEKGLHLSEDMCRILTLLDRLGKI